MPITLEKAVQMISAAQAKAVEMGHKVTVAIVDPRGDLIAMHRMDGARWTTVQVGRGKAFAAVAGNESTAVLAERASRPVFQAQMIRQNGELIYAQGRATDPRAGRAGRCHRRKRWHQRPGR